MKYKVFIFDLDGTLMDTSAGVVGALRDAERLLALEPVSDEQARVIIGPAIADGLRMAHPELPEAQLPELLRVYSDCYAGGQVFHAEVYPCLPETLDAINAAGAVAAVTTAKEEVYTKPLLQRRGLYDRFALVATVTSEMTDKAVLVRHVLAQTGCAPQDAVVIGDSAFDGDAANRAGTAFIAALYGFGFPTAGDAAPYKPVACAQTTAELHKLVLEYLK